MANSRLSLSLRQDYVTVKRVLQLSAEMEKGLKGRIGHRGRAFALLEPKLRELFGS